VCGGLFLDEFGGYGELECCCGNMCGFRVRLTRLWALALP